MKKQIDRFTLLDALGSGGAGSVYRAEEALPGGVRRPVALKVLPVIAKADKAAEARFFAEVKALAALAGHPHIVTVYAIGITDQVPWIAMEFVANNLAARASEQGAPAGEVSRLIEQISRGLEFMHSLTPPLLHNDLKPANILIDPWGNFRITDFSLASLIAMDRTHVLATVRYAAPELLSREFGKICPATDLYALGHVAYEMALGGRAYRHQFPAVYGERDSSRDAPPAKWMAWHCSLPTRVQPIAEIRRDFPRPLSDLIAKLMAKAFTDRYAAAGEVLRDLQAAATDHAPAAGHAASATGSTPPPARSGVPPLGPPRPAPSPAASAGPRPSPYAHTSAPPPPPSAEAPSEAAAATSGLGERYYVRLRGKVSGPFDLATLQRQARQGQVSRLHQVSTDQVTWRGAGTVQGLFNPAAGS